MLNGARCIIFDLDGTISDPSEGISNCINHALARYDYDPVEPQRVAALIGPPLTEIFEELVGPLAEDRLLDLVASYRERYGAIGYRENTLYGGISDVVATLHDAGHRLGICTSKRADYASMILAMFGLDEYFDFVDGGDIHIRKVMQLERLVASGLDADTAVMIGDRAVDIAAARHNRIAAVAVSWGFGGPREIADAGPDAVVDTPHDLWELFK